MQNDDESCVAVLRGVVPSCVLSSKAVPAAQHLLPNGPCVPKKAAALRFHSSTVPLLTLPVLLLLLLLFCFTVLCCRCRVESIALAGTWQEGQRFQYEDAAGRHITTALDKEGTQYCTKDNVRYRNKATKYVHPSRSAAR